MKRVTISETTIYMCLYGEDVRAIRTSLDQVYRPSGYFQSDHDKFIEDEGGE